MKNFAINNYGVVRGFNQLGFRTENSQGVEMVVLTDLNKCPKIVQPLCATNGNVFLYFQNKCHMEVKNLEVLTQGLMEFIECPLIFCKTDCPKCAFIDEPVCAAEAVTGEKRIFGNSCEVERTMCTTKRAWTVVHIKECVMDILNIILKPLNNILQSPDCPKFCPLEHRPICARFMGLTKEFKNVCELKSTICRTKKVWHIIRQGHCLPSDFNTGGQIATAVRKCSKICSSGYKPICATLHNELRVFNNRCELDNIICQSGHNWQVIKEGPCLETHKSSQYRECPEFCLNELKPVCARFGQKHKEFRNLCELLKTSCITNTNWQILNLGPCISNSKPLLLTATKCPQACTKSYKPVCAIFGKKLKEFRNQCELQKAICETNTDWKPLKNGRCPLATYLNSTCRKKCTKEFMPVCASHNGKLKEFVNSCELDKHSCETNTAWILVKSGTCPLLNLNVSSNSTACPLLCPKEYKPICAIFQSRLREFDSECEMERARCENNTNWQLLKTGRCPLTSNIKGPCSRICAQEFSPVCARFNGKLREFFNSCELEKITCKTNTTWEVLNKGPCFVNQFKRLVKNSCEYTIKDPVCAIYGYGIKTFDNVCQLAMEIERSGNIWSVLHRGRCSDFTSSTTNETDENSVKSSVTKWATTNDISNIITVTEGQPIKEEISLKQGKAQEHDESDEEEDYDEEDEDEPFFGTSKQQHKDDDADYDLSSSDESSFSDDDETFRHWTQAQIHTLHSDEDYSNENDDESLQIKAFVRDKNTSFNYELYSQEDDASVEINSKENNETNTTLPNPAIIGAAKSNDYVSQESELSQNYLEQETAQSNNVEECSESDREVEKQNCQVTLPEWKAELSSKVENVPSCQADTSTLADKNYPENNLQNEQSLKITEKELKYNTLKSQTSIIPEEYKFTKLFEEHTQTVFDEENCSQNYAKSESDKKAIYTKKSSESFEENSTSEKHQQSSNQSGSASLTDIQQNNRANVHSAKMQYSETKRDEINSTSKTESDAAYHKPSKDYKLHVNETISKKGEIYNGAVYKAPVYDAPTYNFIYTAPLNYPGYDVHHANQYTSLATQTESGATAKVSFQPFHLFTPLAAMNGGNFAESNLMSSPQVNNHSLKQILNYVQRIASKEKPPKSYLTSPTFAPSLSAKLQNSLPPGELSSNGMPLSAAPSSKPHFSPSLTQQYATPLNKVDANQNATLLNEIIKTLKTLTNQV